MASAFAAHREKLARDGDPKYPYSTASRFAAQYRTGNWLHYVSNLPKSVVKSLSEESGGGGESPHSVEKVKMDDVVKESEKYQKRVKKRKALAAPSVKEVRKYLQHMVNFSSSHYEAEFKSAYPLLAKGGKVLEESDSEDEGDDSKNERGVVDKVKNAKKLHEAMIKSNPNIPAHRK